MELLIIAHLGKNCTGIVMDYLKDPPKLPFLDELLNPPPMRIWLDVLYSRRGSRSMCADDLQYLRMINGKVQLPN